MQVLHMILGLERLDRITMFIDEVASMPLGGGRGLSGRLDSRELPLASAGAPAGTSSSWQAAGHQQGTEEEQRQRQQGRGVKQLHTTSAGPSPLGSGRSSMPDFQAGPPPVTTGQGGTDSAFPLNPHKSYDEEWGTMPSGGGHDSDSDVYLTPHAESAHFDMHQDDTSSGFRQQAPHALSDPSVVQPSQSPSKSSASAQLSVNGAASQPWLQPHRRPPEPPHPRLDLPSSASAPVGPPTGPPSTPERPHPSTSDKFYSPQHQQQQQSQAYTRSPSSLLSRASARIRVALEASEATIKAGPADPPPRQPGLPPSSGHRRTSSHQVQAVCCIAACLHVSCSCTRLSSKAFIVVCYYFLHCQSATTFLPAFPSKLQQRPQLKGAGRICDGLGLQHISLCLDTSSMACDNAAPCADPKPHVPVARGPCHNSAW